MTSNITVKGEIVVIAEFVDMLTTRFVNCYHLNFDEAYITSITAAAFCFDIESEQLISRLNDYEFSKLN